VAAAEGEGGGVRRVAALAVMTATAHAALACDCPVTLADGEFYGNESLRTILPPGGKFIFKPGGAGFVDRDGALGIKFAFDRLVPGTLQVGGRRLDGDAPPARAYIYDYVHDAGSVGFQPIYLVFPAPGCWEITGSVADQRLSFVVYVEKIGAGPDWKFAGPEPGWRVTYGPDKSP
jgi:hypothetical protein